MMQNIAVLLRTLVPRARRFFFEDRTEKTKGLGRSMQSAVAESWSWWNLARLQWVTSWARVTEVGVAEVGANSLKNSKRREPASYLDLQHLFLTCCGSYNTSYARTVALWQDLCTCDCEGSTDGLSLSGCHSSRVQGSLDGSMIHMSNTSVT